MDKTILVAAGRELRRIRDEYGYPQLAIQNKTEEEWGTEDRIQEATLSRIERGVIVKPPSLLDMAQLGKILYLTPTKMFEMYHLPVVGPEPLPDADEIVQLRQTVRQLRDEYNRPDLADDLIGRVSYECTYALHRARSSN